SSVVDVKRIVERIFDESGDYLRAFNRDGPRRKPNRADPEPENAADEKNEAGSRENPVYTRFMVHGSGFLVRGGATNSQARHLMKWRRRSLRPPCTQNHEPRTLNHEF